MKKLSTLLAVAVLSLPLAALAETWSKVPLIDHMCRDKVKADPDKHPTACLIKCANSGYGIVAADGSWLKLDASGNEKALAALKATSKKDHIRVDVTGERKGDTIQAASVAIAN